MRKLHAPSAVPLVLSGLLAGVGVCVAACGSREPADAVPSITTLAEDPILLSRVLERCNANPAAVATTECTNARAAADRRMADDQAAKARQAEAGFEAAREARRRAEAAAKQAQDATRKPVDAYELPVEGAAPPAP
jgi:hypothetical protein